MGYPGGGGAVRCADFEDGRDVTPERQSVSL